MGERRRLSYVLLAVLAVATGLLIWMADQHVRSATLVTTASPAGEGTSVAGTPSGSPPAATASATPPPTAVFLGDGYTAGVGDTSWADLVAAERGWREVNLAVPGMGFRTVPASCPAAPCTAFDGQVQKVAAAGPSVVFVMGGSADGRTLQAATVDSFAKSLRAAVPDATIYLVNPVVTDARVPAWVGTTTTALKSAASAHGATFVDIGQPLSGKEGLVQGPGAPTDAGDRALADAVLARLA